MGAGGGQTCFQYIARFHLIRNPVERDRVCEVHRVSRTKCRGARCKDLIRAY